MPKIGSQATTLIVDIKIVDGMMTVKNGFPRQLIASMAQGIKAI
jgi:hypothetical protein